MISRQSICCRIRLRFAFRGSLLLGRLWLGQAMACVPVWAQLTPEYELPPISYSLTSPSNRVTELQRQIERGELTLANADEKTTLHQCLKALDIAPDTQVLVFSKTSLQRQRIHPKNPRALYFADDCYLGWVPGGVIEIAVSDPRVGLAFYQIDPRNSGQPPTIKRDSDCLSCHAGPLTRNWPSLMIRSVFPDESGEPIGRAGSFLIEHDNPLSERWGGWYVTGEHGQERHMGNAIAREVGNDAELDREAGANLTDLTSQIPTDRYLRPDSDIVALMILEHQVGMHNRLVEGGLRVRKWTHYQEALQKELGEPTSAELTGTALRVLQSETKRIVEYMLFVGEVGLSNGGIQGNSHFQQAFRQNRRADPQGRSLKDLDLQTRLFAYRCSYMIYSQAFDNLPASLKSSIYEHLREILTTAQAPAPFSHLGTDERQRIHDILLATKTDLAEVWSQN